MQKRMSKFVTVFMWKVYCDSSHFLAAGLLQYEIFLNFLYLISRGKRKNLWKGSPFNCSLFSDVISQMRRTHSSWIQLLCRSKFARDPAYISSATERPDGLYIMLSVLYPSGFEIPPNTERKASWPPFLNVCNCLNAFAQSFRQFPLPWLRAEVSSKISKVLKVLFSVPWHELLELSLLSG